MPSRRKIKRSIPNLLVDGLTTEQTNHTKYVKMRYRFQRLPWEEQEKYVSEIQHSLERLLAKILS